MKRKVLSILLCLCMVLAIFPVAAFAEEPGSLAITISGPDVVCSWQDYEFTVTPPAGVTLDKEFGYDTGMKGGGADLTVDADGVGHGVVLTDWYDLQTNCFTLTAHGNTADGTPVTGTKTVQVSPKHIFVDGVCGCGVKQYYIVTYDPGEYGTGSIEAGVKTYDEPFTLSSETFTREGYVQTGWRDANYWMYFALGDTYYADEDVTLYPIWEKLYTLTVPFTTTVKLGGNAVPGETTFDLAIVGANTGEENYADVSVSGSVTTNGAGDYEGTLTITGPERQLWYMLSEGAFVQQVNAGEENWTYDDTVYGLLLTQIAAYSTDDAALPYTVLILPAISVETDEGVYYDLDWEAIDWENDPLDEMSFTNTYTKTTTKPVEENKDTGDNSNSALWFALLAVSAAGAAGTVVYGKRRRNSRAK